MRQFLLSASAPTPGAHEDDGGDQTADQTVGPSAPPVGDTFLPPAADATHWRQTLLAVQVPGDPLTRGPGPTDRPPLAPSEGGPTVVTTVTLLEVKLDEPALEAGAVG